MDLSLMEIWYDPNQKAPWPPPRSATSWAGGEVAHRQLILRKWLFGGAAFLIGIPIVTAAGHRAVPAILVGACVYVGVMAIGEHLGMAKPRRVRLAVAAGVAAFVIGAAL